MSDAVTKPSTSLLGRVRFERDKQQIAALLILTGLPEVIQPLAGIVGLINNGGSLEDDGGLFTITSGLPFSTLFGYVCCVTTGTFRHRFVRTTSNSRRTSVRLEAPAVV